MRRLRNSPTKNGLPYPVRTGQRRPECLGLRETFRPGAPAKASGHRLEPVGHADDGRQLVVCRRGGRSPEVRNSLFARRINARSGLVETDCVERRTLGQRIDGAKVDLVVAGAANTAGAAVMRIDA